MPAERAREHSALLGAELAVVPTGGGRRSSVLHRMLLMADMLAGATAALAAGLAVGASPGDAVVVALTCVLALPVLAFVCGLYAADDLRSWATGVPEVKRVLVAILAMSWALHASAVAVGIENAGRLTLVGSLVTFVLTLA
ncbi:MAG: hypothetical protein M3296_00510, partial [Actinomycetota bacterium]|nr:hypothetical protein [Actinomycetota bacterium]